MFCTVSGRNVKNRFTQFILYLHGFTGKRLPILAGNRKQSPKGALGASLAGKSILLVEIKKILLIALAG